MTVPQIERQESLTRDELLEQLPALVDQILNSDSSIQKKLMKICILLEKNVEYYDWVGFYIADPDSEKELVLGPFIGEVTNHTRIPFGMGICGQVAESKETFISEDVSQEGNYLSCNSNVKSEIVVPILKNGKFVAQLDIDSNTIAAITDKDREVLEEICSKLPDLF